MLVVLLGAIRCVQACEWVPAGHPQPVKKSCHGAPEPAAPQACGVVLTFDVSPSVAVDAAALPPAVALPAPEASDLLRIVVFRHLPPLVRLPRSPLRL